MEINMNTRILKNSSQKLHVTICYKYKFKERGEFFISFFVSFQGEGALNWL